LLSFISKLLNVNYQKIIKNKINNNSKSFSHYKSV